jgi:two-component system CheB/CheR fusion protein
MWRLRAARCYCLPVPSQPVKKQTPADKKHPFPVVVVACPASDPAPLREFLAALPKTFPGAILAAGCIPAPAAKKSPALDGARIAPGKILRLPAGKPFTATGGKLSAARGRRQPPLDTLLGSAAAEFGDRCAAVILSARGSDGALGARAVKEAGGLVLVQSPDPNDAESLPASVLLTAAADIVESPRTLAQELARLAAPPRPQPARPAAAGHQSRAELLRKLEAVLKRQTGFDLSDYKRESVSRRIDRRMGLCRTPDLDKYIALLQREPSECDNLAKDILIGVTSFFRDREAFERLRETVIPGMLRAARGRPLRIWCAGCSTGEEAYTVGMLVDDALEDLGEQGLPVKMFATDLDRRALEIAGRGIYPASIADSLPRGFLRKYFTPCGPNFQIARPIRERIVFARHNLLKDPPFLRLDLATCRNLLIYLQPPAQERALGLLHYALRPEGVLMLGRSEALGELQQDFTPVDLKRHIFFKNSNARTLRPDSLVFDSAIPLAAAARFPAQPPQETVRLPYTKLMDLVVDRCLGRMAHACFVNNAQFEIVYSFGETSRFATLRSGRSTMVLTELLPEPLAIAISSAASKALSTGKPCGYSPVALPRGRSAGIAAESLRPPGESRQFLLVFIEDLHRTPVPAKPAFGLKQSMERISSLEQEIREGRARLQTLIETLEATNEELQTSNEELQVSNEELQSANEELESVNEELQTLNHDHQEKILELTKTNEDLDNFISSSNIATLFLDTELRLRRFTPTAARQTGLLPHDTGRKVTALSHPILAAAARAASKILSGAPRLEERLPCGPGGQPLLLSATPFLRKDGIPAGAIISFIPLPAGT